MTTTPLQLRGLWVPLITPFDHHDKVDRVAIEALIRRVAEEGADGIVALGTTGEPAVLSDDEQHAVVATCARVCREAGVQLIVGTGTNSTRTTIEASQMFGAMPGVAGVLVVVPYYTRPSGEALIEHYRMVAAASPVPVVAYNVPYRTGRELSADEVLAIAAIPNVVGIKQAVGSFDAATLTILRDAPHDFAVLAGDDAFIGATLLFGGAGAIAACAHVCTPQFSALVRAGLDGDATRTRELTALLGDVVSAGFAEPNPAVWKAALHARGELATANLRAPMSAATPGATKRLVSAIEQVATKAAECAVA